MSSAVAVVGAGVSGLTSAVLLAESGRRTSIFAEETGQGITSRAAAAIWYPYDAEPLDRVVAWALETFDVLAKLGHDRSAGVSMIELRMFTRVREAIIPDWAVELGARKLESRDLRCGGSVVFRDGFALQVPLTDTTLYLDYLRERFVRAGGVIETQRLNALEEIGSEYETVVNCAGIGARELARDQELEPHRGQVVLVSSLNTKYAVVCDDPPLMYAVPRHGDGLLGGTNTVSDDRTPNDRDTVNIVRDCAAVFGLTAPKILCARVGLRPFRKSGVRLERANLNDGRAVIHNYGHGGSGFTLSWGCAREVVDLIGNH